MKKLRYYISLIPYIIEGWTNWFLDIISDIKYSKEFAKRREICKGCDKYKLGICTICGCVVQAKTRCEDSECPVGKWSSVHHRPDK
jgi:hypothetical protein